MSKFKEVTQAEFEAALKAGGPLVRDRAQMFDPPMERYHDEATKRLVAYRIMHDDRDPQCYVEET
ncbi:MAG: hypothetical protein EON93_20190 [Burkholderiales bacterium]|nr:MAG: hypothetical protein EON93_20190 [Burkholderiales bacterium]